VERPLSDDTAEVTIREATEADHARLSRLIREWWDERPPRLERLWFRHFAGTTFVAVDPAGRPVGLAIAFRSAVHHERGVLNLVAVAPKHRRRGLGRSLVGASSDALRREGAGTMEAAVWPGNRTGVRFLEALGFTPVEESLATRLYGVPAFADYDGTDEDRAILEMTLT
jgi:GNAT superfamily N-acetyltransferase